MKIIVVNKTDFYKFDKFADKLMNDSGAYEVKIIEDFSEINAENVSDEIMENTEDTMNLVEKYIDDTPDLFSEDKTITNKLLEKETA